MTVRIHADPLRHRLMGRDADPRLAWTRCGIRFSWGVVPGAPLPLAPCPEC